MYKLRVVVDVCERRGIFGGMMRYLSHRQIDRLQWDILINHAPNGLIYALSWYLDIVSPNWEAIVKEVDGRYVAVMPLPVRTRWGIRYLAQPVFAQQLGVFCVHEPTAHDWQQIGRLLRQKFWIITQYAFNTRNVVPFDSGSTGLVAERFTTYHLSLAATYPQLLAGYKANRRWRLNQARRRHIVVEPTTDIDLLVQIFAENTAPKIYGVIGEDYEYRLLRALYAAAQQRGLATMWQARDEQGEVVAMLLLFAFREQLTYIFNCSTAAGKAKGAISVLLDEVFRKYAGANLVFDFEAPEVSNVAGFYSSFGSAAASFPVVSANQLPWPLRQLKAARMAVYRRLRPQPAPQTS